jgi:hypothetical protein
MKPSMFILLSALLAGLSYGAPVEVPAGIDHAPYERLLQKYVTDRGLVDYKAWKASAEDLKALHEYTAQFAKAGPFATGHEKAAGLLNAYNALTLQWILENYPVKSIKSTSNPWDAKRWTVGGRPVSLDEIEHDTLRPLLGYRVHAVLVCAARSCPPLRNRAFEADRLEAQLDERMRVWLAREDLNQFLPAEQKVALSKIISWYRRDFETVAGGLRAVLAQYAPAVPAEFLASSYRIEYRKYDWNLNQP